jgi:hypothetical protein
MSLARAKIDFSNSIELWLTYERWSKYFLKLRLMRVKNTLIKIRAGLECY